MHCRPVEGTRQHDRPSCFSAELQGNQAGSDCVTRSDATYAGQRRALRLLWAVEMFLVLEAQAAKCGGPGSQARDCAERGNRPASTCQFVAGVIKGSRSGEGKKIRE